MQIHVFFLDLHIFVDVGLAAYLNGIEEPGQIPTHPLRGSLFENLVVAELMKFRLNRGRDPQLHFHFYRDSNGLEVDVLFPVGPDWLPVEIKSAQTVPSDAFAGLNAFSRIPDGKRLSCWAG
ncbi:MAG: DUF4143 domain-containing protein [Verrucomicrobia bacterium]|nr:DUF4143 domain-containing protein [Verrucomicrobiota bacterium]MCH8510886.1 DUF4143 domain-containing protein [Kiritimatiellia bacterium]